MPSLIAKKTLPDFYTISRSHMYWGRKPFNGLQYVLENLRPGEVLLDPSCGGGTSIITALFNGARVIGSDLNPMAVFLSKTLIQPVSLFSLERSFETIQKTVAENILDRYKINCPKCQRKIYFDYLQWNRKNGTDFPESVKFACKYCGIRQLLKLEKDEIDRQVRLSGAQPEFWIPKNRIQAQRKTNADYFHELFTGRNLSALSELYNTIKGVSSARSQQNLQYTFTAILYSCSQMQMFSKKSPSSSRGWTAPRFYLPPVRMERNVWKAFEARFKNVLNCKKKLNSVLGNITISDSLERFETSADDVYIHQSDYLLFPFPQKLEVSHVYIDPPYNDDIDYLGFSEFWGSWLNMEFPLQESWRPGLLSMEENAKRIHKLLKRVRENTNPSCNVILSYGSKRKNAWPLVETAIFEAGYEIKDKSPIFFDNPQKRKPNDFGAADHYLVLRKTTKRFDASVNDYYSTDSVISEIERRELKLFLRVSAFLMLLSYYSNLPSAERIREMANDLIRPDLKEKLSTIKKSEIIEWTSNYKLNRKAYNTFCLSLINQILSKDGLKIIAANKNSFEITDLSDFFDPVELPKPMGIEKGSDFVASDKKDRRLVFCFFKKGKEKVYTKIAKRIVKHDRDRFNLTHFLIFPRYDDMFTYRQVDFADYWPRGFLLSFDEILKRMTVLYPDHFGHFSLFTQKSISDYRSTQKIGHFTAEVEENFPVKDTDDCKHYRLKFIAPELKYVVPGQFVMIDTLPASRRKKIENKEVLHIRKSPSYAKIADLSCISYLKRPFSIHRAFYKHFKFGYLGNIFLPPNLAPVSHTVFPNRFEIFYKVLNYGIGTNELKEVRKGDKIEMIGPLGEILDLSDLRNKGFTEVHLIGGGVGMAPLIFFGQALKFYSFEVKAFIGIDQIETLLYSAPFAPTFSEDPENAYVYLENLSNIGLDLEDIYLSIEHDHGCSLVFSRLGNRDCHTGFVSEQYSKYLKTKKDVSGILAITCGPQPMIQAMEKITNKYDIPLKILLEKRMACGIGVCMSCVCKTKKDSLIEYSRVCKDGPIFDAKDIVWD